MSAFEKPLSTLPTLRRLPTDDPESHIILVGNNTGKTSSIIIWFPVVVALCFGFISPFMFSSAEYANLLLIIEIWMAVWVAALLATLTFGCSKHLYELDLTNQRIQHLNSGHSAPLALEIQQNEQMDELVFAAPFPPGFHLDVGIQEVVEMQPEQAENISIWKPSSLKEQMGAVFGSSSFWLVLVVFNLPVIILHLMLETIDLLVKAELSILVAWITALFIGWLLDWRNYRNLQRVLQAT